VILIFTANRCTVVGRLVVPYQIQATIHNACQFFDMAFVLGLHIIIYSEMLSMSKSPTLRPPYPPTPSSKLVYELSILYFKGTIRTVNQPGTAPLGHSPCVFHIGGRPPREWDVMWVSHLCGSGRYVGFVPGGVGMRSEPAS